MTTSAAANSPYGSLYVVATPIGNLDDISARALNVLRNVALIAAEDTRHSARLMQRFGIGTPLVACHEHNERDQGGRFLARLLAGDDVALISDAGTPLISDARLEQVKEESRTLIFYEAPHRILECLQDMQAVFGDERPALLARELTKTFETLKGMPLAELAAWVGADSNQQRGECVVLVAGWQAPEGEDAINAEALRILNLLLAEMPLKRAAALAAEITGVRKNLLYQAALARQKDV
jgi:16S rRNA (cytidine1402-2'-O)-methyltransferase